MKNYVRVILLFILLFVIGCAPHTGLVQYNPSDTIMYNNDLGKGISIAILDFPDRRHDSKGKENLIGTVYGGYKNPLKRIYSKQTINLDIMDAMENLFTANGFSVKQYAHVSDHSTLSDERLVVKGWVNKFWTESMTRVGAVVDIDVEIYDREYENTLWNRKIEDYQKRGMGGGVFQDPKKMVLFLNEVLSSAIKKAWTVKGMRRALEGVKKS